VCDRYTEVANNVQMQETILTIQYVLLDSSPLKFAILAHCQEWQNKFTGLLYEIATSSLNDVNSYIDTMKDKYVSGAVEDSRLRPSAAVRNALLASTPKFQTLRSKATLLCGTYRT